MYRGQLANMSPEHKPTEVSPGEPAHRIAETHAKPNSKIISHGRSSFQAAGERKAAMKRASWKRSMGIYLGIAL